MEGSSSPRTSFLSAMQHIFSHSSDATAFSSATMITSSCAGGQRQRAGLLLAAPSLAPARTHLARHFLQPAVGLLVVLDRTGSVAAQLLQEPNLDSQASVQRGPTLPRDRAIAPLLVLHHVVVPALGIVPHDFGQRGSRLGARLHLARVHGHHRLGLQLAPPTKAVATRKGEARRYMRSQPRSRRRAPPYPLMRSSAPTIMERSDTCCGCTTTTTMRHGRPLSRARACSTMSHMAVSVMDHSSADAPKSV